MQIRIIIRYVLLFSFLSYSNSFLKSQTTIIFDEAPGRLRADAGPDIYAPSFSTIMLDASRSVHAQGSLLRYEWFLPPSLAYYEDYSYDENDSVSVHIDSTNKSSRNSWKSISTESKYIEIELPEYPSGTVFSIALKIKDPIGFVDTDTLRVIYTDPIPVREKNIQSDFKPSKRDSVLIEESIKENSFPSFLISIQPMNTDPLYLMESDIINQFIYNEIKKIGIINVLNPKRIIPDSVVVKELVKREKIVFDTVIVEKQKNMDSFDTTAMIDTQNLDIDNMDSTDFTSFDTTVVVDTLEYDEIAENTLYYNFKCKTDSCAAENGIIENATHVLSWGFNKYAELDFRYFEISQFKENTPVFSWVTNPISMDPEVKEEIRYPYALEIGESGLYISSSNTQKIYSLSNDQKIKTLGREIILGKPLLYPSSIASGPSGRLYVSDKDNHRVFLIEDNMAKKLLDPKLNSDGNIDQSQPKFPISIDVGKSGNIYVLYEKPNTIIKVQSSDNSVSIVLKPNIISGIVDIAVNSEDLIFATSSEEGKIYRIDSDTSITQIAGSNLDDQIVRNNINALESFLGNPISIDFDVYDNLYVADARFGLVRKIDKEGFITTLAGVKNKIEKMNQLKVSKDSLIVIYLTQPLDHTVQRIKLEGVSPFVVDTSILNPNYYINKNGIYSLEEDVRKAIWAVLKKGDKLDRPSILKRVGDVNRRMTAYISRRPLLFAIILLVVNQAITSNGDSSSSDLPPDWPF